MLKAKPKFPLSSPGPAFCADAASNELLKLHEEQCINTLSI